MKIGFTGTRQGLTPPQMESFVKMLEMLYGMQPADERVEFHHGDCAGADAQAHAIVATTYGLRTDIHIHPPISSNARAFCDMRERPQGKRTMTLVVHDKKDYLNRNHDIVDECDVLVAVPKDEQEVVRSGTWATIRYARKRSRRTVIISPNGFTRTES